MFPRLDDDELPTEAELRTWNQESQEAYFDQRRVHWYANRHAGSKGGGAAMRASNACRERGLWPGGTLPMMRDRLLRYDFCRSQLRPCETRTDVEASSSSTSDEEDEDNEEKKADEQEQKWVREIMALAKQTDKSGLSAKAKTLFRTMKADLRNSASSSEDEEDSDIDSSESDFDSSESNAESSDGSSSSEEEEDSDIDSSESDIDSSERNAERSDGTGGL